MPQLSIETFVSQYFWLVVILFGFYYIAVTEIIPKISETLKTRKKIESLGESEAGLEESIASKQSSELVSKSIATSKLLSSAKVNKSELDNHFKNSNNTWIHKTLG